MKEGRNEVAWSDDFSGRKLGCFSADALLLPGILTFGILSKPLQECETIGESQLAIEWEKEGMNIYPVDPTLSVLSHSKGRTLLFKDFGARRMVEVQVTSVRTSYQEVLFWPEKCGIQDSLELRLGVGPNDKLGRALLVRSQHRLERGTRRALLNMAGLGFSSRKRWQMLWKGRLPLDEWADQFPSEWVPHFIPLLGCVFEDTALNWGHSIRCKTLRLPSGFNSTLEDELHKAWKYLSDYGRFVRGFSDTLNSLACQADRLPACFQPLDSLGS